MSGWTGGSSMNETAEIQQPRGNGLKHKPDSRPFFSPGQRAWRRFRRNCLAMISAWYLILLAAVVIAWPIVLKVLGSTGPRGAAFAQTHDPEQLSDAQFAPPDAQHWFGTDVHGRDSFSRVSVRRAGFITRRHCRRGRQPGYRCFVGCHRRLSSADGPMAL